MTDERQPASAEDAIIEARRAKATAVRDRGDNPFAIMNDRLLNNPIPPREADPSVTPQMQEIIYRALEREPTNRYASAREFAHDLSHQNEIGVAPLSSAGAIAPSQLSHVNARKFPAQARDQLRGGLSLSCLHRRLNLVKVEPTLACQTT